MVDLLTKMGINRIVYKISLNHVSLLMSVNAVGMNICVIVDLSLYTSCIYIYIIVILYNYIYTHHIICIYSYSSRSLWMCHILLCFSAIQLLWIGWREMTLKTADVVGVKWILDEEKIPQSMVDASQEAEALKTSKNQDQRVETSKWSGNANSYRVLNCVFLFIHLVGAPSIDTNLRSWKLLVVQPKGLSWRQTPRWQQLASCRKGFLFWADAVHICTPCNITRGPMPRKCLTLSFFSQVLARFWLLIPLQRPWLLRTDLWGGERFRLVDQLRDVVVRIAADKTPVKKGWRALCRWPRYIWIIWIRIQCSVHHRTTCFFFRAILWWFKDISLDGKIGLPTGHFPNSATLTGGGWLLKGVVGPPKGVLFSCEANHMMICSVR